ncbi:MAG: cell division protein ZapA [Bacteroidota bacterium]|nr:cell division protein ZapA [Prevotella sp.]MDT3386387.1 cell division protein ZapA [Bacteroidota bacterium]
MAEQDLSKINIRLHIYDTEIMVRVLREDEALYRKGAELINELLNAYFSNFKGNKSDKEITYFAMIDLALRHERQLTRNDTKPYNDILSKLTSEIESVFDKK